MGKRAWLALLMVVLCLAAVAGWRLADGGEPGSDAGVKPAAGKGSEPRRTLSADEHRTLATLRLVDKRHPLFAMTVHGRYDVSDKPVAAPPPGKKPWACSLFLADGPKGPLFGRNFDWEDHPALLLKTGDSISLVDISYLGISKENAGRLMSDPALKRKLLHAVKLPFDGMNSRGLAVGLASVPSAEAPREPGRPSAGSVRIQRLALDQARTVDEAIGVFQRHNIEFGAGEPKLHYLVADSAGRSAAIEFVEGRMRVTRGARQLVNFTLHGASDREKRADRRYRTLTERMALLGGKTGPSEAMDLLSRVAQSHTRWSAVYELRNGMMYVTLQRDYGKTREFRIGHS